MKVWIKAFGCKVNQYEAQLLRENLAAAGNEIVDGLDEADRVVVQGCAVTERAEKEGLRLARRAARQGREVVIAGCLARLSPPQPESPAEQLPDGKKGISFFAGHSRAFLKVQDGCPHRCAYCLVSRIRGPVRSKPPADALREIEKLAANGYRDVVLCGINLGCYGRDSGTDFLTLLKTILHHPSLPAGFSIRLSSLEPDTVAPEILDLMAAEKRIFPHLHLPLQSGSDRILKKMERAYTVAEYLALTAAARERIAGLTLTTDLMVGFPGETEEDFRQTLETAGKIRFDKAHVFRFSSRPGTPAASFPGQVPEPVKSERAAHLRIFIETMMWSPTGTARGTTLHFGRQTAMHSGERHLAEAHPPELRRDTLLTHSSPGIARGLLRRRVKTRARIKPASP